MTTHAFDVDPDIRRATTPPGSVYADALLHGELVERAFARSWQPLVDADPPAEGTSCAVPVTLLEGSLDEPLLLTRDARVKDGRTRCLSNVCTHRGMPVCRESGARADLRCAYHGRRFGLDGRFRSMPEFEDAIDFPRPADDLPELPLERWGPLLLTGVDPALPFTEWIAPLDERVPHALRDALRPAPEESRDYQVEANWMLYCENYLEGFHIPFVHAALNAAIDYGAYETQLFGHGSLQLGVAAEGEPTHRLPPGHPDAGRSVAAWYWWLFPNLMFNVYPWGLSLNIVEPLGPARTRVRFRSYVADPSLRATGAGADLHSVELEDEEVVEAVQRGVRSRLYDRGRYSPTRETGTHHFHRLLAASLAVGVGRSGTGC